MSEYTPPVALRAPLHEILEQLQAPGELDARATMVVGAPGVGMSTALKQLARALKPRVWGERVHSVWSEISALRGAWFADWITPSAQRPGPGQDVLLLDQLHRSCALRKQLAQQDPPFQMDEVARWIARWLAQPGGQVIIGLNHKDYAELQVALDRVERSHPALSPLPVTVTALDRLASERAEPPSKEMKDLLKTEEIWSGALTQEWWKRHTVRSTPRWAGTSGTALGLFEGLLDENETRAFREGTPVPAKWMMEYAERMLRSLSQAQLSALLTRCLPGRFRPSVEPGLEDDPDTTLALLAQSPDRPVTSDYLAGSASTNPAVVRKLLQAPPQAYAPAPHLGRTLWRRPGLVRFRHRRPGWARGHAPRGQA